MLHSRGISEPVAHMYNCHSNIASMAHLCILVYNSHTQHMHTRAHITQTIRWTHTEWSTRLQHFYNNYLEIEYWGSVYKSQKNGVHTFLISPRW